WHRRRCRRSAPRSGWSPKVGGSRLPWTWRTSRAQWQEPDSAPTWPAGSVRQPAQGARLAAQQPPLTLSRHRWRRAAAVRRTRLALMMGIFLTKYAVGVSLAFSPALAQSASYATAISVVTGALSGVFLGRAVRLWRLAMPTLAEAPGTSLA